LLVNVHSSSTQVETLKGCLDQGDRDAATEKATGFCKDEKAKKMEAKAAAVAELVTAEVAELVTELVAELVTAEAVQKKAVLRQIEELRLTRQELTTPLLTTRYSPLTTHYSLLTTHHSPLTTHH
jgi:hypothetical protein